MCKHTSYVVNGGNISRVLERSRGLLQVLQIDCKDASTVQSAYMSETDVKKSHISDARLLPGQALAVQVSLIDLFSFSRFTVSCVRQSQNYSYRLVSIQKQL